MSIIKPIKGADPGSIECLESFFQLIYPRFEITFAVANTNDPVVPIIDKLMKKYPDVSARLRFGLLELGINPKVNTMALAYEEAQYEWIWISDAQVVVAPDALQKLFSGVDNSVGLVSGVVCGVEPHSFAGRMECTFLNSFYAKWSLISDSIGTPCVMGKSMLFKKATFARMGGIRALGKFLAEDFMAGQGIQYLGLKVKMQREAIFQWVGGISWKAFWARHIRWGRIRKAQAPIAYIAEPLLMSPVLVTCLSLTLNQLFGVPLLIGTTMGFALFFAMDFTISWLLSGGRFKLNPMHWLLRELVQLPLWFHIGASQKINWRGTQMAIQHGGLLSK